MTYTLQRDRGRAEHRVETDDKRLYHLHTVPYHDGDGRVVGWRVWFADNLLLETDQEGAVRAALAMIERLRR